MNDSILTSIDDEVATVTLNRPHVLNSFNRPMAERLQSVLDELAQDEEVRSVLLKGSGRAFCAGQDLAEAVPPDGSPPVEVGDIVRSSYNPIIRRLRWLEKPVICSVQGVAAGAGANIALSCDLVVAAEDASFIQAFSKIGLIPDSGGTFFLPRLVGPARATALAFLGDKVPAVQAYQYGLIYSVSPPDELDSQSLELARRLANMPTRALALTKRALNESLQNGLEAQLELEAELQGEASRTEDYREGVAAFLEKRKPVFRGK